VSGPPAGGFRLIWAVVARIPRGRVATYGQVARLAGMPGAARTVGWALRALPDGARIGGRPVPWHRVINAEGRTSPRATDADGECARQIERLRREGVRILGGVVDMRRHAWDGRQAGAPASPRGAAARRASAGSRRPNCSSYSR
jgi:methylated-DNA-protein-cysteine methyltransferase-like protein